MRALTYRTDRETERELLRRNVWVLRAQGCDWPAVAAILGMSCQRARAIAGGRDIEERVGKRQRGRDRGRVLTDAERDQVLALRRGGASGLAIARETAIPYAAVLRALHRHEAQRESA